MLLLLVAASDERGTLGQRVVDDILGPGLRSRAPRSRFSAVGVRSKRFI